MITIEAIETRGVPCIKLEFNPAIEQFTKLGKTFELFVDFVRENYDQLDNGFTINPVVFVGQEIVPKIVEPIVEKEIIKEEPIKEEPIIVPEEKAPAIEEVPAKETTRIAKPKKKKVETKLSSI